MESINCESIKFGKRIILIPNILSPPHPLVLDYSVYFFPPLYTRKRVPQIRAKMGGRNTIVIDYYIKPHWVWSKYCLTLDMSTIVAPSSFDSLMSQHRKYCITRISMDIVIVSNKGKFNGHTRTIISYTLLLFPSLNWWMI